MTTYITLAGAACITVVLYILALYAVRVTVDSVKEWK